MIYLAGILPWSGGRGLSICRVLTPGLRNERETTLGRLLLTRAGAPGTTRAAYSTISMFQAT